MDGNYRTIGCGCSKKKLVPGFSRGAELVAVEARSYKYEGGLTMATVPLGYSKGEQPNFPLENTEKIFEETSLQVQFGMPAVQICAVNSATTNWFVCLVPAMRFFALISSNVKVVPGIFCVRGRE